LFGTNCVVEITQYWSSSAAGHIFCEKNALQARLIKQNALQARLIKQNAPQAGFSN